MPVGDAPNGKSPRILKFEGFQRPDAEKGPGPLFGSPRTEEQLSARYPVRPTRKAAAQRTTAVPNRNSARLMRAYLAAAILDTS